MSDSNSYGLNSVSYSDDPEMGEIMEEKQKPLATLPKKEVIEKVESSHLLLDKKELQELESVCKYTNRIKAFLGWEPILEEQGNCGDACGSNDGNVTQDLGGACEGDKEENMNGTQMEAKRKQDCSEACKGPKESDENVGNVNRSTAEKQVKENENGDASADDNEENAKETVKNSVVVDSANDDRFGMSNNAQSDISEANDIHLKPGTVSDTEKNNNNFLIAEPVCRDVSDANIPPKEIENNNAEDKNVASINFDSALSEDNSPGVISSSSLDYTKTAVAANSILPEAVLKEQTDELCLNGNSESNNSAKECRSENEISAGCVLEVYKSEVSDERDSTQSEEETSFYELPYQITDKNTNGKVPEDLRSEDSLVLDEDVPINKNVQISYMKEIRRLSRDIVKDIMETARNSIHELQSNTNEESDTPGENNDLTNEGPDSKFNIDNKFSDPLESQDGNNMLYDVCTLSKDPGTDYDTVCGYGCFRPAWIQQYARPRIYLIFFSIIGVIHGCYYTYVISVLSTLEKRYAFKTKVSGILLLADEITPLILGILVGYIGGRTHRPRMVALGMFMSVACCFISGLPYLMYGPSKHFASLNYRNETGPDFCETDAGSAKCDGDDLPPTLTVVGIFLLASFLKGFATLSYYVIGMSYMDDIIKKKNSPMYFAISLALRLLGPLLGFVMSYGFLKLYENPNDDPGFGPEDPRWIGAWWIGFFLQGVLLFIFTLPIALFPKRLPGQKKIEKNDSRDSSNSSKEIFRGLLAALKRLGKNPVFIVLILNTTMKIFGHFGHAIMLPKYMENQFRLSASQASLYSGATSITCIILATLIGGYLIWKFRPKIKVILAGMIGAEICLVIGYLILMIPRCQPLDMMHFGMDDEGLVLNSVCNVNCDCSTTSFTPFCGPDGTTTYFSPCHAGCTEEFNSSESPIKNKIFGNCSCVAYKHSEISTITEGFCADDNCWTQRLFYLLVLLVLVTISNIFTVAHTMILLRSVHPADKSFALGTFETFICLFGFIPFPVTFGALVDSACLVWEKSCGETGNCWFYDMEKYSYLLHGVAASFCSLSVVCLITLYFLSPRIRNLYEEEEESEIVDIKLDTVSGGSITKL